MGRRQPDRSSRMVIVNIPSHKEEGAGKPSALSSMQELRSYFRQEIAEYRDRNWMTYVFPGESSEEAAGTYFKVLTGSPVVYILTFRQTADMKRRHWLGNAIEGAGYEPSSGRYDSYETMLPMSARPTLSSSGPTSISLHPRRVPSTAMRQKRPMQSMLRASRTARRPTMSCGRQ
jgi:hypothetical protein